MSVMRLRAQGLLHECSCTRLEDKSKEQRKRLEKSIAKYRHAARTLYGSTLSNDANDCACAEEKQQCHKSKNINDRTECKKSLEYTSDKNAGGFHIRYRTYPKPCEGETSRCSGRARTSKSPRKSSPVYEKPCHRERCTDTSNERGTCRKEYKSVDRPKDLDRCTCSERLIERKKSRCKDKDESLNKCSHREKSCEKEKRKDESKCRTLDRTKRDEKSCERNNQADKCGKDYHTDKSPPDKNRRDTCSSREVPRGASQRHRSNSQRHRRDDKSSTRFKNYTQRLEKEVGDCEDCYKHLTSVSHSKPCGHEDSCPSNKLQIRVTARVSTPCVKRRNSSARNEEDTCCSCCSDDEDTFYTPESFSITLRDNNRCPESSASHAKIGGADCTKRSVSTGTVCKKESAPSDIHNSIRKKYPGYFDKEAKIKETKNKLHRPGFCRYILSPFGSSTTVGDKCSKNTHTTSKSTELCTCSKTKPKPEECSKEKEMLKDLCKELQSLKQEIEKIKYCNQEKEKLSTSEVDCLIRENKCLKKEFEELKRSCECDREKFNLMLDEQSQMNDSRRHMNPEPSCGDKSELSRGYNEVMDVVTHKLQCVLKKFQREEKLVCDASTSFTKFTNNYRNIIEEYCKTLSARINEWFECKRRRFEKREEKLKKEYEICSSYIESEKMSIKDKVSKINEKIDRYEKYIECQMNFIQTKYIPDSKIGTPQLGATRNKTEWSDILEPHGESAMEHVMEEYNYCFNGDNTEKNKMRSCPMTGYDSLDRRPSTKTLYQRYQSKPRRQHSSNHCDANVSVDNISYNVTSKHNYPFHEKRGEGKYSILEKIKEYFDKGHKKSKEYNETCISVMSLNESVGSTASILDS